MTLALTLALTPISPCVVHTLSWPGRARIPGVKGRRILERVRVIEVAQGDGLKQGRTSRGRRSV